MPLDIIFNLAYTAIIKKDLKMAKISITNRFTSNVSCESNKSKEVFYDTELSGFQLEVRSTGTKTFYYSYSLDNKRTMHKLGNADTMTADEARHLALKMRKAIATDSLDSMFTKKSKTPTLQAFYEEQYLPYIKVHSNSWDKNNSTFMIHILPILGSYKLNEILPPMISKVQVEMVTKKKLKNGTANKVVVFLRHLYNLAIELKIDSITENPAAKVKQFEELHKERFLTKAEAKRLMSAVNESKNIHLKYIVRYLLLTGARRSEVLRAEWRHIDHVRGIWTIPITKNKKIRKIPISPELQELIAEIPKMDNKWLFPAPIAEGHYKDVNNAWFYARAKAGLQDVRMHDLRHSFASQLVNSGQSLYVVQRLLGHSSLKMTQRYAHINDDSLLKAASCAGKLLK